MLFAVVYEVVECIKCCGVRRGNWVECVVYDSWFVGTQVDEDSRIAIVSKSNQVSMPRIEIAWRILRIWLAVQGDVVTSSKAEQAQKSMLLNSLVFSDCPFRGTELNDLAS